MTAQQDLKLSHQEIQQVELGILRHFDSFCKQHQLKYWLDWGSLIGALRHQGFIPWDNDIDVGMPIQDYHRLIELARTQPAACLNSEYFILSHYSTDEHAQFPFVKIFDTRTKVIQHDLRPEISGHECVWLDVFPVANCLDDAAMKRYSDQLWKLERSHLICTIQGYSSRNALVAALKKLQEPWVRRRGYRYWLKRIVDMQLSYPLELKDSGAAINLSTRNIRPLPAEYFSSLDEAKFEGYHFLIPNHADELLERYYGNWRELPPQEEQVVHDIDAYWVSQEAQQAFKNQQVS